MKNKTVKELKIIAKEIGIKGYYKMRKEELISKIEINNNSLFKIGDEVKDTRSNKYYKVDKINNACYVLKTITDNKTKIVRKAVVEERFIHFKTELKEIKENTLDDLFEIGQVYKDSCKDTFIYIESKNKHISKIVDLKTKEERKLTNNSINGFIVCGRYERATDMGYSERTKLSEILKNSISKGTEIILIEMKGESTMKKGLKGKVKFIDDLSQIHMEWENNSTLALDSLIDKYIII